MKSFIESFIVVDVKNNPDFDLKKAMENQVPCFESFDSEKKATDRREKLRTENKDGQYEIFVVPSPDRHMSDFKRKLNEREGEVISPKEPENHDPKKARYPDLNPSSTLKPKNKSPQTILEKAKDINQKAKLELKRANTKGRDADAKFKDAEKKEKEVEIKFSEAQAKANAVEIERQKVENSRIQIEQVKKEAITLVQEAESKKKEAETLIKETEKAKVVFQNTEMLLRTETQNLKLELDQAKQAKNKAEARAKDVEFELAKLKDIDANYQKVLIDLQHVHNAKELVAQAKEYVIQKELLLRDAGNYAQATKAKYEQSEKMTEEARRVHNEVMLNKVAAKNKILKKENQLKQLEETLKKEYEEKERKRQEESEAGKVQVKALENIYREKLKEIERFSEDTLSHSFSKIELKDPQNASSFSQLKEKVESNVKALNEAEQKVKEAISAKEILNEKLQKVEKEVEYLTLTLSMTKLDLESAQQKLTDQVEIKTNALKDAEKKAQEAEARVQHENSQLKEQLKQTQEKHQLKANASKTKLQNEILYSRLLKNELEDVKKDTETKLSQAQETQRETEARVKELETRLHLEVEKIRKVRYGSTNSKNVEYQT